MRFFFLIFFLFSSAIFSQTQKPIVKILHWQLKNKTHVYFVERKEIPMLDMRIIFAAGSAYDGSTPGISTLTNSMIGEGAKNLSADQIAENLDRIGAQLDSFSMRDMAGISLRTITEEAHLKKAIDIFQTLLIDPTFPADALSRIKKQIIASQKSQNENPLDIAKNTFYQMAYENTIYAHNPLGTAQSIQSISRQDITRYYQRYYVGANATLVLVGDISLQQAIEIAKTVASLLPEGTSAPTFSPIQRSKIAISKNIYFPLNQSTIMLGQVGISRNDPNYFPLIVGNSILGNLPLSSILYLEIREKRGLSYVTSSDIDPLRYRGPFLMTLQTKASNTEQALALARQLLIEFCQQGPTEAQLNAAKKNLIGQFPLMISSNQGLLIALSNIAFYHRPLNYLDTYREKINAVTIADVKNAFQQTVNPQALTSVIVGPKND